MTAFSRVAGLTLSLALALGLTLGAGGCVYRPNIQQGNLLRVEDIDQVVPGMTRSQVRYLLGTPMLSDPFDPQRWDYIYTFRQGRQTSIDRSHVIVWFDGDKVSRVEKLDQPDAPRVDPRQKEADEKARKQLAAEEAAAAAAKQPVPPPPPPSPTPQG